MKHFTRADIFSISLFLSVLLLIIIVLIHVIETAPAHPIISALAGLSFLGLMWLLVSISLK